MSPSISLQSYPSTRLRRNRATPWVRDVVAEHNLTSADLIWPAFVIEGEGKEEKIASMPGVLRHSVDLLIERVKQAKKLGIRAIALFPYVDSILKTPDAAEAINPDNLVCRAVKEIRSAVPEIGIICDVALDPYNSDGHDGLLIKEKIDNDRTIEILCRQAVIQADAGCDMLAPSDMMDGRIGMIRQALDQAGFHDKQILSYAAKYASAFYGPFRDAVGSQSAIKGKDKKTYQMDPANSNEALREVALDLSEGADIIMIKPGMPYLDIVRRIKDEFSVPTFVYQVSGEYLMLKTAIDSGYLDHDKILLESMMSFKRAGADAIISYFAIEVAELLGR